MNLKQALLIILFIYPTYSYAYIDPGSGSIIITALITILVFVKSFLHKIKTYIVNFFKKFNKK